MQTNQTIGADTLRTFRVRGVLGEGAFGTVYQADLVGAGGFVRTVALKVLNAASEDVPEHAQRLRDEARLLGMVRHRAIVYVDELVRLDGRWTVVMEHVPGIDLRRILEGGSVPVGPALQIAGEIAGALEVLHDAADPTGAPLGLLHRDLKPSNILVTPHGEVRVVDFGVAHSRFDTRESHTIDATFGSPGYMPPEQVELQEGPAGDVYALGIVLFEMLTGARFGAAHLMPRRHDAKVDARLQSARSRGVPEPVLALLGAMVAHDPGARPAAGEVEDRISRLLRSLPLDVSLKDWCRHTVAGISGPSVRVVSTVSPALPLDQALCLPSPAPGRTEAFRGSLSAPSLEPPVQRPSTLLQEDLPLPAPRGGRFDAMADTILEDVARAMPPAVRGPLRRAAPWVALSAMSLIPSLMSVWLTLAAIWWLGV